MKRRSILLSIIAAFQAPFAYAVIGKNKAKSGQFKSAVSEVPENWAVEFGPGIKHFVIRADGREVTLSMKEVMDCLSAGKA